MEVATQESALNMILTNVIQNGPIIEEIVETLHVNGFSTRLSNSVTNPLEK